MLWLDLERNIAFIMCLQEDKPERSLYNCIAANQRGLNAVQTLLKNFDVDDAVSVIQPTKDSARAVKAGKTT